MSFLPALTIPNFTSAPSPWQELIISNFSGGLCTAFPESNIRDDQFTALSNYYIEDDNSLKARGPFRPYLVATYDTVLTTAPLSFRWAELGGTDYLVIARDTGTICEVYYWNSTVWSTLHDTFTDDTPVKFVKFSVNDQEDLIFCNGVDTPQRWPGGATARTDLGLTAPDTSGSSGGDTGKESARGLSTGGFYYYKCTYWYESSTTTQYGESNPSSSIPVNVTQPPNPGYYRVTQVLNLPALTSGTTTRLYVYRSPLNQSEGPYRQVGYTTGTTYTDNTPEGEEGVELPIDAGSVPTFKNPVVFRGRLWAVSGSIKNKGIYSAPGNVDLYPALNYAYFPDELIGPAVFNENLYWITTKQIYIVPNGDVDKYPEPLKICDKGATSFDSIVDIGNGLVFQGEDNVYWADFNTQAEDGDFPVPIGEPIKDKIETIPSTYRSNSAAAFYKNRYYLSYTGPNQTVNSETIVWDVIKGTRLLRKGLFGAWTIVDWAANDLQNFKGTLYSADNIRKYIMEHDWSGGVVDYHTKTEYDATTSHNITASVTTKRFHFGHEWAEKIINSLSVAAQTSGATFSASLSLNNDEYTRGKIFTLGSSTPPVDSNWLIWGQGTWNNFNWGETTYAFNSDHIRFPGDVKCRSAKLGVACSNIQDANLILLKLYYKPLPPPS